MKKYIAKFYHNPSIEVAEADRETEKYVFFGNHMYAKNSESKSFHDTFEEAKSKLVSVFEKKAQDARRRLEVANGHLGNAKGLKQPCHN